MKKRFFILALSALIFVSSLCACDGEKSKYVDYSFDYFDTVTVITGYAYSEEEFYSVCELIKRGLREYHTLYNIYNSYDGVNNLYAINNSTVPVKVDEKVTDLLVFAKEAYDLTDGKVNIAMGSVLSLWHRYRTRGASDPENATLPPMDKLVAASEHTDIEDIVIDKEEGTVWLADPEMKVDVGAIAKGYAVEKIASDLETRGISGYMLNVGGNVRAVGSKADGSPWAVGIEDPQDSQGSSCIAYLHMTEGALVTSGSYQRYYTVGGKKYHHIIDPETLMPGENFISVSVLCGDSALGDVLSTALFSMSYEEGLSLVESVNNAEAVWVLPDGTVRYSSGFEDHTFDYNG